MIEMSLPSINFSLCNRCGQCVSQCPENTLKMTVQGPAFIDPVNCTYCGTCEHLCPTGAIRAPLQVSWRAN